MPDAFPLADYLARIAFDGPVSASPATLVALHRCHAFAIPFENIDPLYGRPVSVEPADLVEKIIRQRRGGYCFEQNGLFLLALEAIGFRTRALCARVQIAEGRYGPRSHQVTIVEFEGGHRWLADVGFGGNGLIEPIPFELECEFDQGLDRYRLVEDESYGYRLEHHPPAGWRTLYAFSLDPYLHSDFQLINYGICRAPDSIFTRIPLCVRTMESERRILVADRLKIRTRDGLSTVIDLHTSDDLHRTLTESIGLSLPDDLELRTPSPAPPGMREI